MRKVKNKIILKIIKMIQIKKNNKKMVNKCDNYFK